MVAAARDPWQAGAVRRLLLLSVLVALSGTGAPPEAAGAAAPAPARREVRLAQAATGVDGAPRTLAFSWTLYPRMWAEIDLRLAVGAEAVAEVTAEGGEVSWNVHLHPLESDATVLVTLAQGVAGRATVRCAPESDGRYSYLFANEGSAGPVRLRIELTLTGDARLTGVRP
jgi:hypothetical protein